MPPNAPGRGGNALRRSLLGTSEIAPQAFSGPGRKTRPVTLRPCSACNERVKGPLASLYWAWNDPQGARHAYKQWLCVTCYCTRVLGLIKGPDDELLVCPVCHEDVREDFEPLYCKIYMPGQPADAQEWACCPAHGQELRLMAGLGAEALPDRQNGDAGSAPKLSATAVWDALGLKSQ